MYALKRILALAALAAAFAVVAGVAVSLIVGVSLVAAVAWALLLAGALLAVYPVFMFSGARPRLPLGLEPEYARHGLHYPSRRASRGSDLLGTATAGFVLVLLGLAALLVA